MKPIVIRDLHKYFGGNHVLKGVNLSVEAGTFLTLLGPSGCGKTTLLRCIAGLETPDSGSIRLGDMEVFGPKRLVPPAERGVGMVFQSYAIWPHMTVEENVAFALDLKRMPRDEVKRKVDEALTTVGLTGLNKRYASQLSGGQMQRVALARSLVLEPDILLFDEPLSNLDAKLRETIRVELRRLQRRLGFTAVYVTHDQIEAMALSDLIFVMEGGEIVQRGSPEEIYLFPETQFVADFIGQCNLLPATVTKGSEGATSGVTPIEVKLASGKPLRAVTRHRFTVGESVTVVIRPERLRLKPLNHDGAGGTNGWPARVADVTFFGDHELYEIEMDGLELMSKLSPPAGFRADDKVWAEVAPEDCFVIPPSRG